MAPVLLTDRLRLDGHRADDLDALVAMWAQPEVYGLIGDRRPRPRGEVWKMIAGGAGHWALLGYGGWTLRDRASGAVLGTIGLMDAQRDLAPPLDAPELGYALVREAQGRGLAREAMGAALGWADGQGIARTQCIIDPENAPSIAVATAMGYAEIGSGRFAGAPEGATVARYERRAAA